MRKCGMFCAFHVQLLFGATVPVCAFPAATFKSKPAAASFGPCIMSAAATVGCTYFCQHANIPSLSAMLHSYTCTLYYGGHGPAHDVCHAAPPLACSEATKWGQHIRAHRGRPAILANRGAGEWSAAGASAHGSAGRHCMQQVLQQGCTRLLTTTMHVRACCLQGRPLGDWLSGSPDALEAEVRNVERDWQERHLALRRDELAAGAEPRIKQLTDGKQKADAEEQLGKLKALSGHMLVKSGWAGCTSN